MIETAKNQVQLRFSNMHISLFFFINKLLYRYKNSKNKLKTQ